MKEFLFQKPSYGDGNRLMTSNLSVINVESEISCCRLCSAEKECFSFNVISVNTRIFKYLCELKSAWYEDVCSTVMLENYNHSTFFYKGYFW